MAGEAAHGATVYVTLEPCSHHGRTPPCCDALIAARVARVVVATGDPDPRVNGAGLARLAAAGIAITKGVLRDEADELIAGFCTRVMHGRPLITLKLATTLDGRIATRTGESQWITGPAARRQAHALRGRHDAVLVGVGTVLADDPQLTCRLPGYKHVPMVRVVADSQLRTSPAAKLVQTAWVDPTWMLVRPDADPALLQNMAQLGVRLIEIPRGEHGLDLAEHGLDLARGLAELARSGITSVLVESGAKLAASLLRADLVDRMAWFHAPAVMGGDGLPAAEAFGVERLASMKRFRRLASQMLDDDMLTEWQRIDACLPGS
jgi:diaminohydroxyphosphoribosylaminopyrimidine deaminase/5-amino-6-(5-phosphoribosylamino)uracil reductase